MQEFLQQLLSGIATGGIYASLALALVLIYNAMGLVNFAQGEMAMFATFLAFTLLGRGVSYWVALPITIAIAFIGGIVIQRVVIRPVERAPVLTLVIVTLGWGLASAVGAVSEIMVAPILLLEPNMMQTVIIYAFAAAVLGGIESPLGAVIGGLIVGVTVNLAGAYLPGVGGDLQLAVAFAIIIAVLVVRPNGLLGRRAVRRA